MATLIRRDPFHIMDALFGGDAASAFDLPATRAFAPAFDVSEVKDAYVFRADVPGVPEKELEIQVLGNVLTVAGERKNERVEGDAGRRHFTLERGHGRFSRSFSLPDGADGERATAEVKDGVLTLRVPKRAEVQPRRINVGAAKG
jgi:HSP20 family protein